MEAYVFYSHSDYSDIWPLMFGQSEKFLNNKKKYLITNKICDFDVKDWNVIYYDDSLPYQQRVYESLEKIKEEIVIFHHEDMFLLNQPQFDKMKLLIDQVESGVIDMIKLIKAEYSNSQSIMFGKNIYKNPLNLSFAIQPTIIKKKTLYNIYKATRGSCIWEFEKNSNNYVNFLNFKSCYYFDGTESKRGMFHWDSNIYPYIATAVVKGKWDYKCYFEELEELLKVYNINPNKRGINV